MAVTVRGSLVSGQAGGSISGNFTIATPSSTVTGDYLIIALTCNKDAVTPASGWTLLQNGQAASLASQSFVYGRVATASGTTNYTWNLSNTTAAPDVAVCWAFGNVDSTKIVSGKSAEDTTSPATTPTITTTVPSLMMHIVCDRRGTTPSITWTYPAGYTKAEGTNDGSVGYTASGATGSSTVAAGSQAGVNITGSASPSTSFAYQVGLGDGLVQITGGDGSSNVIENGVIAATVPTADTGTGTDTAFVKVPVPVTETATATDVATVRVFAAEAAGSSEATKVLSGGSTLAFASDDGSFAEASTIKLSVAETGGAQDVLQTSTIGIQGTLPYGPRIVYVMPVDDV